MIRWKIHTSLPLVEYFEITTEAHSLFVVVKEIRNFRCGRMVRAHDLVFFVVSRPAKHEHMWNDDAGRLAHDVGIVTANLSTE